MEHSWTDNTNQFYGTSNMKERRKTFLQSISNNALIPLRFFSCKGKVQVFIYKSTLGQQSPMFWYQGPVPWKIIFPWTGEGWFHVLPDPVHAQMKPWTSPRLYTRDWGILFYMVLILMQNILKVNIEIKPSGSNGKSFGEKIGILFLYMGTAARLLYA